ncbi:MULTISPECIES: cell wall metabolism sensor histidine kinase WalK [Fusobacterium]|uniref:sensor histidine kinase n=1 Tax=Fusobacterium TaxID=848 RepID=UPI0014770FB5|nr:MULTISPECIES: HAMP domain-containing sensor histidine kinase [Fusobacterium]NME36160.1 HAMP domain-containing histidine kinase [Fusobacterium sp. FSA-380-WT-3A]
MKIKTKILLLTSSIITVILVSILGFNQFAFEKYYLNIKKKKLISVVDFIKRPDFFVDFTKLEEENNIKIFLTKHEFLDETNFPLNKEEIKDIFENGSIIYKITNEKYSPDRKLLLVTKYDKELLLVMFSPLSTVIEPVEIINGIYIKLILFALAFGYLMSLLLTKILSNPIISMVNTAKKVAELDFSERFNFSGNDEIGELGRNLNIMEENLKKNFELLKKDIEIEKENEKTRKQFISNISHELKTPIAIINNYTEGLREGIADDEETRNFYLDTILEETENMSNLVNSLLFLSRSERNFLEFNPTTFDIKVIINSEIERLSKIYPDKIFKNNFKGHKFLGDSKTFSVIIKNLLENACKYSEDEFIYIFTDNNTFKISNKSSLDESLIDKIWIPFYRVDSARDRTSGTGLGLAIVKELLEKQNFKFGAFKEEDKIVFWIKGGEK